MNAPGGRGRLGWGRVGLTGWGLFGWLMEVWTAPYKRRPWCRFLVFFLWKWLFFLNSWKRRPYGIFQRMELRWIKFQQSWKISGIFLVISWHVVIFHAVKHPSLSCLDNESSRSVNCFHPLDTLWDQLTYRGRWKNKDPLKNRRDFPASYTLKCNIAPKHGQSQKETHLPTIIFQGQTVKFQGCMWSFTGRWLFQKTL